jgi:ATP-dependent Clp protease ATP-binding subunit ClpA
MTGELFLYVRTLPSGRVVGTPIPFTDVSVDGDSLDEVRSGAREEAIDRVEDMPGVFRAALFDQDRAELGSARVKVSSGDADGAVVITVGLVVVERPATTGRVYVAYAPGVSEWSVAAETREQVLKAAAASLTEQFENWSSGAAVALDQIGEVSLERLALTSDPEEAQPPPNRIAGDDMVELARQGRLGRLDRRAPLVERVLAALAADGRASVLIVGSSDVGKTALVHEVAARLASGDVPPALRDRPLWRTSANELMAGARYIGMWQERARNLIAFARKTGAIVAMGDPTGIVDAGRWSESDNNLGRVLRPYVERGEIRLICEATDEDVAAARKLEPSFIEVFYRVDVPEPDVDAAFEILRAAARRIETNHGVPFTEDALEAALRLTRRFEPYRALPGKAVRLLEEAAQLVAGESSQPLGREEITRAFAGRTGMPIAMLSDRIALNTRDVEDFFEQRVLGQPEAIEAIVDLVAVIKAALNDPAKPLATMFFVGPTGVGKTELTKALAEFLFGSRDRVLRFDMGEYATGDAVARLTGSAWEHNGEGELTRRVREQPFCVVLLDELEKAHQSVFDVLLPALGEGRLTDASGRTADLRNAVVIMTSNLGAERHSSGGIGFARTGGSESEQRRGHFVEEAEAFFRPEFFNRIDRVLPFDPLDRSTITRIARREIGRLLLREGITRRRLLVEIGDGVVDQLATAGFHPRYGARPLHREIERAVIRPLARLIVEQQPAPGDLIRIEQADQGVNLTIQRIREHAPAPQPRRKAETPREATLARALANAQRLQQELHHEQSAPPALAMGAELSDLLERINAPGFWDEPENAQQALTRVYQLQRVSDRFSHLRNRLDGLVELAQQLKANRDRTRLPELRDALDEASEELALVRLECVGAAAGDTEPVVEMTFVPIGPKARDWANELAAVYVAWAERTGREAIRSDGEFPRLAIRGPGSHALLAREGGLHRRELPDRRRALVRVTVLPHGQPADGSPANRDEATVVRVYTEGARTGVRDPRTGARVGNLRSVLQGHIDEFILANIIVATAEIDREAGTNGASEDH